MFKCLTSFKDNFLPLPNLLNLVRAENLIRLTISTSKEYLFERYFWYFQRATYKPELNEILWSNNFLKNIAYIRYIIHPS